MHTHLLLLLPQYTSQSCAPARSPACNTHTHTNQCAVCSRSFILICDSFHEFMRRSKRRGGNIAAHGTPTQQWLLVTKPISIRTISFSLLFSQQSHGCLHASVNSMTRRLIAQNDAAGSVFFKPKPTQCCLLYISDVYQCSHTSTPSPLHTPEYITHDSN